MATLTVPGTTHTSHTFEELSKGVRVFDYKDCKIDFEETIGQGTSMNVHEGTCTIDGVKTPVAFKYARQLANKSLKPNVVKIIFPDLEKEIKYMNRLKDVENVVQFYGLVRKNDDNNRPILVLELANQSLEKYLEDQKDQIVDWEKNLDLCFQIAKGTREMHKKGIIHGDIKGSNILVFEDKDKGKITLKLSDFGFSSSLSKPRGWTGRTVPFAAPECLKIRNTDLIARYDDPSHQLKDIYSYGLVAWQIAKKGEVPFGNLTEQQIEERKMKEISDDLLKELPQDTPPSFREIIMVTTKSTPSERERFPEMIIRISNILGRPLEDIN